MQEIRPGADFKTGDSVKEKVRGLPFHDSNPAFSASGADGSFSVGQLEHMLRTRLITMGVPF